MWPEMIGDRCSKSLSGTGYPVARKWKVLKGVIDEIVQLVNASPDVTKVSQIQTAA